MNRIVLSMVMVGALAFGGVFASTASAHGPPAHHGHHHHHHHGYYRPAYPIHGGYCVPYGGGYYSSYPGYYSARPQPRVSLYFGF
jgi:Spy/CpxP family protein refolding chaperone